MAPRQSLPVILSDDEKSFFKKYKFIFWLRYLQENRSLRAVKKEIEEIYKLDVFSKTKYEAGFEYLGFVKKAHLEDWTTADAHIKKRKRDGKDTKIFMSGKELRPERLDRTLRRNSKRLNDMRALAVRQSLPELPSYIDLKTPPPQQSLVTANGYPEPSYSVRESLFRNPVSSIQLLSYAPTSQLWDVVAPRVGFHSLGYQASKQYQALSCEEDARSAQIHEAVLPSTPTTVDLVKWVMHVCTLLANGFGLYYLENTADVVAGFSLIKIHQNLPALKAFFGLDSPAVQATWKGLITLFRLPKLDWEAFQILVEIGFQVHGAAWIKQNSTHLIRTVALGGWQKMEPISSLLLSKDILETMP
ncbi:hypothetical protein F5Y16DRAFT_416605 [Xylariaceae sp. FL0255]|nr:hypothetical protein F5Y16DRAFT_416605 [Xylariaceae sp. FL0255]